MAGSCIFDRQQGKMSWSSDILRTLNTCIARLCVSVCVCVKAHEIMSIYADFNNLFPINLCTPFSRLPPTLPCRLFRCDCLTFVPSGNACCIVYVWISSAMSQFSDGNTSRTTTSAAASAATANQKQTTSQYWMRMCNVQYSKRSGVCGLLFMNPRGASQHYPLAAPAYRIIYWTSDCNVLDSKRRW